MNTPMVILVGILLVVLMAVTAGAADINEQAGARISTMEQELKAALEMRDAAVREVAALKADVVNREQDLAKMQEQYNALDAHVRELNGIIVGLQDQLAVAQSQQGPQIPITGGEGSVPSASQVCLVSRAVLEEASESLVGGPLWIVIVGVVALGGGAAAARHSNHGGRGGHVVTVRMTRSQLQEYIRYQRQSGNRVQ